MRALSLYICTLIFVVLCSCSSSDFTIEGNIQGLGTQNMRVISVENEALRASWLPAVDGTFTYRGSAKKPVVIEFYNRNMDVIVRVVAKNGDKIKISGELSPSGTLAVKGSKITTQWLEWLDKHPLDGRNEAIEQYVLQNRGSQLSGLLLAYDYTTPGTYNSAMELLDTINEEALYPFIKSRLKASTDGARAHADTISSPQFDFALYSNADSTVNFKIADKEITVIHLWNTDNAARKQATKKLEELRKDLSAKRFRVIDIATQVDTFAWKQAIRPDSVKWLRFYAPGGVINPVLRAMQAENLPLFFVVDSAGKQHYKGLSIDSVTDITNREVKKSK